MRSCLRCHTQMVEGLEIKTYDTSYIAVGERGLFKGDYGKLLAAACPNCGYVEAYLKDTSKINKAKKQEV